MKKDRLHVITFAVVSFLVILVIYSSFRALYSTSLENIAQEVISDSEREARMVGIMLETQLASNVPKEKVINDLQKSIINTDTERTFICMYNNKGIELCHPNPSLVGTRISDNNSQFVSRDQMKTSFLNILKSGKKISGVRNFQQANIRDSEIISVYPVKGSDWMVAAHVNINAIKLQIYNLYQMFVSVFVLAILIFIVLSFIAIHFIYKKYVRIKAEEIKKLNADIIAYSRMNEQLKEFQQKNTDATEANEQSSRKRFTTYYKDEIISLNFKDIAYFYLQEGLTYMRTVSGNVYPVMSSLEDVHKNLDDKTFYRANRQVIFNIESVKNILLFGKNQLKIILKPDFEENVLISKNKVSDFKKWLER